LQLVHGYPPAVGGVEFAVRDVCERLVAHHGFEVTVLTTNAFTNANFLDASLPTIPIRPGETQNGVSIHRFPVQTGWAPVLRVLQKGFYRLRLPGNDWLRAWYQGPISIGMLRAVREMPSDVISAASFPLNHLRYPFMRPEPRPPVVLLGSVHTNDAWGYERPHLLRLTSKAYATVAHTEHERQWLLARGAPADRVTVIPEGIDPEQPRARPGAFRAAHGVGADALLVAYVGQQGSHKGIEVLMDCWPRLLGECPGAWLVVAGSRTPYTEVLERRAAQLRPAARERFRLLHDLEPQAKADLLTDCDIFASPSGYESFGITTLEAWSQAKPVIVGDGPAQREVVEPGVAGLLVPYRDEGRLLEALLRLARRPELRRSLGDAGRARLRQRYTIDKVAAAYAELYERAHAGAGR
jgi:glycosyltransferase involved in cell wall biosynthesis